MKIPRFTKIEDAREWFGKLSDKDRMEVIKQKEHWCLWVRIGMITNVDSELKDFCFALRDFKRL